MDLRDLFFTYLVNEMKKNSRILLLSVDMGSKVINANIKNNICATCGCNFLNGECSIVIILFHPSFKTSHSAVGGNAFTLPFISYPLH